MGFSSVICGLVGVGVPKFSDDDGQVLQSVKWALKDKKVSEAHANKYFDLFCDRLQEDLVREMGAKKLKEDQEIRKSVGQEKSRWELLSLTLYSINGSIGNANKHLKQVWNSFVKTDIR